MTTIRRLVCAIIASIGVASMHYYGMSGLHVSGLIEYDASLVMTSLLICGVFFGLTYTVGLSEVDRWRNLIGLAMSALAVAGLHYTGASAVNIIPLRGLSEAAWTVQAATVELWIVLSIIAIVLVASLAAGLDEFLFRLHARQKRHMGVLADAATESLFIVSADGVVLDANAASEKLLGVSKRKIKGLDALNMAVRASIEKKADLTVNEVEGNID